MPKNSFLILLLLLFGCQESIKNTKETPQTTTTKIASKSDTILLKPHQLYAEYWADSAGKVEFSASWVEKVLAYRKDTLPTSLTKYLLPIFKMPCMQEKLYFDSWTWNLDADAEDERILFFYNKCWVANDAVTIILEKEQNGWQVGTIFRGMARYPLQDMMPTFDEKQKILSLKNGSWGMAMDWLDIHLLKKIEGKYRKIGKIDRTNSFFSGTASPSFVGVTVRSYSNLRFVDAKHIEVMHYFSIMEDIIKRTDFILIKDRPLQEILEWDNDKKQFVSLLTIEQEQAFMNNLEKDLANLAYYGTFEQKQHLKVFLEGFTFRNRQ